MIGSLPAGGGAGQIVDTDAAREFMREAMAKVDEADLAAILGELEAKSRAFRSFLAPERLEVGLGQDDARHLLRSVFATRRHADEILRAAGAATRLTAGLRALLDGSTPVAARLDAFVRDAPLGREFWKTDLASECLHFSDPGRYWLWTRWMWDPVAGTGSLPLVVTDGYRFDGATPGQTYLRIGEAVAFVQATAEAADLAPRGAFGVDVFLVSVYAVYVYTVLRMRMTQEFNQVIPGLPDLARRLLGIRAVEV